MFQIPELFCEAKLRFTWIKYSRIIALNFASYLFEDWTILRLYGYIRELPATRREKILFYTCVLLVVIIDYNSIGAQQFSTPERTASSLPAAPASFVFPLSINFVGAGVPGQPQVALSGWSPCRFE